MNILDNRIIAILRDVDAENIVDVINALVGGGIISIEIPLNHSTPAAKAASLRTIQNPMRLLEIRFSWVPEPY